MATEWEREQRAFIRSNRKRSPKFNAEWLAETPARVKRQQREASRAYHKKHPEIRKAAQQKRRVRIVEAPGCGVTASDWRATLNDYASCCAYCGVSGSMEMEHVEPINNGGEHDPCNIVPACKTCNNRKRTRTLVVWLAVRMAMKA